MSFFDAGKACTFSEMSLTLTYQGEPASGAKVVRTVEWQKPHVDEFYADDAGKLVLPELHERSLTQLLPVEFVVAQAIHVHYLGQEFEIWINSKRKPEENAELGGRPVKLRCELTDEPQVSREFDALMLTSCQW
ncbi:carboxypeptidase regulatory-like domain-containing protein [Simiduia sp. 21SJ11W-1]|uniref:DUF6795 domain-containing protein n=1 Tax=Simiduia sp. 21SJ11W-1 TaxID=2909669 RepID=UPI0020A144BA|nr:DUF6795 domain-containing protein [Simiduia sp. 21SJ11W-1]UTA46980.1 carboxypeptidase regulatory-like domain-containing protein [Simiduia sp. 21SJ11W-1]